MAVTINGDGSITGLSTVADPGSNGVVIRTSSTTAAARTITAGTGISVSNGDGVSGNPTITNSGVTSVNGSTGAVTVSTGFAAGTKLLFAQTAAPTGWTKDTTSYNNHALRVVTGTASSGGSVDFTTAFASQTPSGSVSVGVSAGTLAVSAGSLSVGSTTLSTSQMPAHNHVINGYRDWNNGGVDAAQWTTSGYYGYYNGSMSNTGGGGSHNHGLSGSPSLSGSPTITSSSFTGTAINLAVKYLDTILATKD